MHSNRTIKPMTRDELDIAVEWAALEGWNPGIFDAESFYAADPKGFFISLQDDEPVATISAVKYSSKFGFIGFYIVKPEFRGQGDGLQIWNTAIDYLTGANMGLDGVVAQQENYQKFGFKLAYRNIRFEGISGGVVPNGVEFWDLQKLSFKRLCDYDRPFFAANRSTFLQHWIKQPNSVALGLINGESLVGYGVIRPCRSGYKIGPLFADNPDDAESLFVALSASVEPGSPVYLDVPEVNTEAILLAERHQLKFSFETARMYTQKQPAISVNRTYGVTSFELG